jgi:hypothetical protein
MINLPLACMSLKIGSKIKASMGEAEIVDTDGEGIGWGKYLRVKIRLHLKKPFPKGRKINIEVTSMWITFQYECLLKLYFQCGVICHGTLGCPKRNGLHQQEMNQYGHWLRGASYTQRTEKNVWQASCTEAYSATLFRGSLSYSLGKRGPIF